MLFSSGNFSVTEKNDEGFRKRIKQSDKKDEDIGANTDNRRRNETMKTGRKLRRQLRNVNFESRFRSAITFQEYFRTL